jgi:hypothetical protein
MCPGAPYFTILLNLMPDDFIHQKESAATQWVNQTICPCTLLTVAMHLFYYFTLSNARRFYSSGGRVLPFNGLRHKLTDFQRLFKLAKFHTNPADNVCSFYKNFPFASNNVLF